MKITMRSLPPDGIARLKLFYVDSIIKKVHFVCVMFYTYPVFIVDLLTSLVDTKVGAGF